jgi:dsRNA-specific ribonuclease
MSEFKISHDDDIFNTADGLVFNPYNPNNVEITLSQVQSILTKYGVPGKVHNIALYNRAFVHKSYTKRPQLYNIQEKITITEQPVDCLPLHTKSNERLEFLGDGVLECITKYYLYRRFPKENEGFMTEKKIAVVKNEAIGKLALEMGLHKYYIISKHADEKRTRTNLKKLGCLFEAFLGALFLDFNKIDVNDEEGWFKNVFVTGPGFQMAQIFIESVFEKHIDWVKLIQDDDNYKNILQVKIQKKFQDTPHYIEINHNDETGYEMGVYLCLGQKIHAVRKEDATHFNTFGSFENIHKQLEMNGKIFVFLGSGVHKIKRKAEQMACEETLKLLE